MSKLTARSNRYERINGRVDLPYREASLSKIRYRFFVLFYLFNFIAKTFIRYCPVERHTYTHTHIHTHTHIREGGDIWLYIGLGH